MKKLALALMCLVSVAFFASCQKTVEHPEPIISVMVGDNYVSGDVDHPTIIDITNPNVFNLRCGFHVEANAETKKELSSLKITLTVNDEEGTETSDTIIDLSGKTSYDFDQLLFPQDKREIYLDAVLTALVTDVDNKTNTATIAFKLDLPAQPLATSPFSWYRLGSGNNAIEEGLEEFGLYWEKNIKATHAQIKPLDGVTLYKFNSEVWKDITTDLEKNVLFAAAQENGLSVAVYNNVSTSAGATYDDVIGTVMPDGTCHLIHVLKCEIGAFQPQGYPITITGEAK